MTKEIKITIVGVIFFLFVLTMLFVGITIENGGFAWSLLWDAFILTMIAIGMVVICEIIVYLLDIWIDK